MQNLMQIHCSTRSLILNVTTTQYTCTLNSVLHPPDLYSEVIIVHTCAFQSTLPGCQVPSMSCKPPLFILKKAGLASDRPYILLSLIKRSEPNIQFPCVLIHIFSDIGHFLANVACHLEKSHLLGVGSEASVARR